MTATFERVLNALRSTTGFDARKSGSGWKCRCPAHDDHKPSLSVSEGDAGRMLIKCLAGCSLDDVLAAAGLTMAELFPQADAPAAHDSTVRASSPKSSHLKSSKPKPATGSTTTFATSKDAIAVYERTLGKPTAVWEYHDADGQTVGVVVRWDSLQPDRTSSKQIRPVCLLPDGRWALKQMREPRPLFRRGDVRKVDVVFVVEGEKAVDAAVSLGLVATTSAGGAEAARLTDWTPLAGKSVVIIPDNDDAGRKYAQHIAGIVTKLDPPATVRLINLADDWPEVPEGGDIADWCDAHDAVEPETLRARLQTLVDQSPDWQPPNADEDEVPGYPGNSDKWAGSHRAADGATHRSSRIDDGLLLMSDSWPESIEDAALCGLAGQIVGRIGPHSEADPVALLISLLIAFGNLIGRTAYFQAEGSRHFLNLFAALVGKTSKGRKGSSWSHVARLCGQFDEEWAKARIAKGLSSGEGFIHAVRDPVEQQQAIKEKGRVVDYELVVVDPGIEDKRLLVIEEEFASVLAVTAREGNILSPRLREAWDSGNLRTMTKNPVTATGAHVSIIGHITRDELRRTLNSTEQSNGFANRFLWLCVQRSKCLPEGGRIHEVDFSDLVKRLEDARHFATAVEVIERDDEARAFWHEIYPALSEGKPGLTGAMLGRAEAQVMRLACLYALLDRSYLVRIEHLKAALALWDYCEASTKHIFGNSLGNKDADEILAHLQASTPEGLTRTEISREVFHNNSKKRLIDTALKLLFENQLAHPQIEQSEGRAVERWFSGIGTKETKLTK